MSWDVFGNGLRTFSDGFGMVLEKISDGVEHSNISKMAGSMCSCVGLFLNSIFSKSPAKNIKKYKMYFSRILPYISI